MKKTKVEKGITLIALIITIIVLLILAVVSIRAIQGDGILTQAKKARDDYGKAQEDEKDKLKEYELIIAQQLGKTWKDNGDNTFTKENETVTIGDYVEYNHKIDENGNSITGDKASYTSPKAKTGRYSDATFSIEDYSGGWRVLGVNSKGQLELVAENWFGSFGLVGMTGYNNGIEELNNICKIYGNGKYAESGRSLTAEDINKVTGYTPQNINSTTYGSYGSTYKFKQIDSNNRICSKDNVETTLSVGSQCPPSFMLPNGSTLGNEWSEEFVNGYYEYSLDSNNISNKNIAKDLFRFNESVGRGALATQITLASESGLASYNLMYVFNYDVTWGEFGQSDCLWLSHYGFGHVTYRIKPVITLDVNATLSRDDNTSPWKLS